MSEDKNISFYALKSKVSGKIYDLVYFKDGNHAMIAGPVPEEDGIISKISDFTCKSLEEAKAIGQIEIERYESKKTI